MPEDADPSLGYGGRSGPERRQNGGLRPVPDPTTLTTQQLLRELASLKEVVFTRLDAMDKAIELFNDNVTRVPTDTDKQIGHLKELMQKTFDVVDEKFANVETRFVERDERVTQTAKDSKVAVDAALQAAKEAVGEQNKANALSIAKSEVATQKQIDQQSLLITSSNQGLKTILDDMKDRLTRIESEGRGGKDSRASQLAILGAVLGVIGGLVGAGGFLYAVLKP